MSIVSPTVKAMAAITAYAATTQNLDLNQVQFVVVASPGVRARLYDRAMTLFAKADLPLPHAGNSHTPATATLTLTLDPHPLDASCPDKVLYGPSLLLVEPVIIQRNSVVINDTTWLLETRTHVRNPVEISNLETDLDRLIQQFITDYKAGNPGWHSRGTSPNPERPRAGHEPTGPIHSEANDARANSSLRHLNVDTLQVHISAGRFRQPLTTRAIRHLREAGLLVPLDGKGNGAVTLGVELTQHSLEDQCPGHVLYESGLYLVEEVRIKRNPQVSIWSDTWLRETMLIVAPVPLRQLESDQDALLNQFIRSFQTR
ncbi:MAG: hypothetical protein HXY51_11840 [Nitrospirae bacterium]|nr:hypothetical protein [Nitrospirota bacterium]